MHLLDIYSFFHQSHGTTVFLLQEEIYAQKSAIINFVNHFKTDSYSKLLKKDISF